MVKFTILKNKENKIEIYGPDGNLSARCLTEKTANELVEILQKDYKFEEPVNDNSVLQSPIAKMTRDLLGKNY